MDMEEKPSKRDYEPVAEFVSEDAYGAIRFLNGLSEDSKLGVTDYGPIETRVTGCYPGEHIAENLVPEPDEGAYLAIYDWQDVDDLTTIGDHEIYVAISDRIPGKGFEGASDLRSGSIVEGFDERLSTSELRELADTHLSN